MRVGGLSTWLSSGLVGLVVGAAVGLVLSALFEEYLSKYLRRVRRRLRHFLSPGIGSTEFEFAGVRSPCIIVEGDGSESIREDLVHVIIDETPVELPAEIAQWRDEITEEQRQKKCNGEKSQSNDPCFAVERLVVDRTEGDEEVELTFRLRRSNYFSFLASQYLDRRFSDGSTPRERYLLPAGHRNAPVFMSLSLGTSVLVITTDNKVLVCQRSANVGSRPLYWGVSADEGLSVKSDSRGGRPPRIYEVARRGLWEELSLEADEYQLSMLAVTIDTERHQWDTQFVAYLHGIDSAELLQRLTHGAKDKNLEINDTDFIQFEIDPVLSALRSKKPPRLWTPVAPVALYLALVHEYGRLKVERAGRRYEKRHRS